MIGMFSTLICTTYLHLKQKIEKKNAFIFAVLVLKTHKSSACFVDFWRLRQYNSLENILQIPREVINEESETG